MQTVKLPTGYDDALVLPPENSAPEASRLNVFDAKFKPRADRPGVRVVDPVTGKVQITEAGGVAGSSPTAADLEQQARDAEYEAGGVPNHLSSAGTTPDVSAVIERLRAMGVDDKTLVEYLRSQRPNDDQDYPGPVSLLPDIVPPPPPPVKPPPPSHTVRYVAAPGIAIRLAARFVHETDTSLVLALSDDNSVEFEPPLGRVVLRTAGGDLNCLYSGLSFTYDKLQFYCFNKHRDAADR